MGSCDRSKQRADVGNSQSYSHRARSHGQVTVSYFISWLCSSQRRSLFHILSPFLDSISLSGIRFVVCCKSLESQVQQYNQLPPCRQLPPPALCYSTRSAQSLFCKRTPYPRTQCFFRKMQAWPVAAMSLQHLENLELPPSQWSRKLSQQQRLFLFILWVSSPWATNILRLAHPPEGLWASWGFSRTR